MSATGLRTPARSKLRALAGTLLVLAGKAALAGAGLMMTVLLSRALGTAGFGVYATAVTIIVLAAGLVQHAVDASVLRLFPDRGATAEGRARLFAAALAWRVAGIAAILAVLLAARALAEAAGMAALPAGLVAPALLAIIGTVLMADIQLFYQAQLRFRAYIGLDGVLNALRAAGYTILLQAGLLQAGVSAAPAALGVYAGSLVATAAIGLAAQRRERRLCAPAAELRALASVGGVVGLAYAMSLVQSKLDVLMLAGLRDGTQTGLYAAALTLAMVLEFAASFLLVVTYPRIMPWLLAGQLRRVLGWSIGLTLPVAVGIAALGWAVADPLMRAVYGAAFAGSAPVFAVLVAGSALMLVVQPIAAPLLTMRNPRLLLQMEVAALGLAAAAYALAIPAMGATGAAWVTLASRFLTGGFILVYAWRSA